MEQQIGPTPVVRLDEDYSRLSVIQSNLVSCMTVEVLLPQVSELKAAVDKLEGWVVCKQGLLGDFQLSSVELEGLDCHLKIRRQSCPEMALDQHF